MVAVSDKDADMRDPNFDLTAAIDAMPDTHLLCRDFGHTWRRFMARHVPAHHVYEQTLRCTRCKTLRERVLNERGIVVSSKYVYPDGYLVKGMGYLAGEDRGLIRLAAIQSDLAKQVA